MQFGLFEDRGPYYATIDDLVAVMMKLEDDPLFPAGTNMVIYRGNPKARLMIIGEAPGPELVASAIAGAVEAADPPLRIPVGPDAEMIAAVRSSSDDASFEATMRATLGLTW